MSPHKCRRNTQPVLADPWPRVYVSSKCTTDVHTHTKTQTHMMQGGGALCASSSSPSTTLLIQGTNTDACSPAHHSRSSLSTWRRCE